MNKQEVANYLLNNTLNPAIADKVMNCVCPRIFHLSAPTLIYFSEKYP